jgi:predicted anti-sigma-YlaC factor YlaD
MIEHVTEWLNAYLDGELSGLRLRQVEGHLTQCAACRHELDELRGLSALLKETPPPAEFMPTERFAANLAMRLPRRPEAPRSPKAAGFVWWLAPAGTLVAWVLVQIFLGVSTLVSAAGQFGLLGNATAFLQGAPQHSEWFTLSQGLFGADLGETSRLTLQVLDQANVFGSDLLLQLALQALIALAYWAGLGAWLLYRRRRLGGAPWLPSRG